MTRTNEGTRGMAEKTSVRIPYRDQLWLQMDTPDNLMYINSLMWFEEVPDWDAITTVFTEKLVDPYPVFRRVSERRGRRWYWVDFPDFDVDAHFSRSVLPGEGGRDEAEKLISERISVPLPAGRPLWSVEFLENYHGHDGPEGQEGALVLFRVQHGLVDGVRLTQLLLSMCEIDDDALPPKVGRDLAPRGGLLRTATEAGAGFAKDSFGIARGLGGAAAVFPWTLTKLVKDVTAPGFQVTRVPARVVESLTATVSPTNKTANTYRALFRLLWEPRSPRRSWSGRPGVDKRVSWISGVDLAGVKRVAKAHDSTVTIVMTAAVSRALTEYLKTKGDKPLADINLMIPMSVAPAGEGAPSELGNHITLILLRLPLGVEDSQELINDITASMARVQYSFEPHTTYAAIVGSAAVPSGITNSLVDVVANKSIGQLTSVPGPSGQVKFGGTPVGGLLGWVPMTGAQSLGVCIYSYNGQVSVGIATDAGLVPEPGVLAELIGEQFETFAGWND